MKNNRKVLDGMIEWVIWAVSVMFLAWVLSAAIKLLMSGLITLFLYGVVVGAVDIWLLHGFILLGWRSLSELRKRG